MENWRIQDRRAQAKLDRKGLPPGRRPSQEEEIEQSSALKPHECPFPMSRSMSNPKKGEDKTLHFCRVVSVTAQAVAFTCCASPVGRQSSTVAAQGTAYGHHYLKTQRREGCPKCRQGIKVRTARLKKLYRPAAREAPDQDSRSDVWFDHIKTAGKGQGTFVPPVQGHLTIWKKPPTLPCPTDRDAESRPIRCGASGTAFANR